VRIFLSLNSKDAALAKAIRAGLFRLEPDAKIDWIGPTKIGHACRVGCEAPHQVVVVIAMLSALS
jgi:hypothetical protein